MAPDYTLQGARVHVEPGLYGITGTTRLSRAYNGKVAVVAGSDRDERFYGVRLNGGAGRNGHDVFWFRRGEFEVLS